MRSWTSSTLVLNTSTPQGCVLSPVLFTAVTRVCSATHFTNTVVNFRDNDETHYREETQHLTRCLDNILVLSTSKNKGPLWIAGVERVHIASDLSWWLNTSHLVKKAQQRLYFLGKLKRTRPSSRLLVNFY